MEAHAERRMASCDAHSFLSGWFIDHQTGLGQEAGFMAALDGFVDFVAAAEVVACNDEGFQFLAGANNTAAHVDDD